MGWYRSKRFHMLYLGDNVQISCVGTGDRLLACLPQKHFTMGKRIYNREKRKTFSLNYLYKNNDSRTAILSNTIPIEEVQKIAILVNQVHQTTNKIAKQQIELQKWVWNKVNNSQIEETTTKVSQQNKIKHQALGYAAEVDIEDSIRLIEVSNPKAGTVDTDTSKIIDLEQQNNKTNEKTLEDVDEVIKRFVFVKYL